MRDHYQNRAAERFAVVEADLLSVSREIHAKPEIAFEEEVASDRLCTLLERADLDVERGVGDIPTAFVARSGSGSLHVALCAEYDSLPGIGHACGHNIIGTASVGAGIALSKIARDLDLTVSVIGTPAEELGDGGGKILLMERGVFDGVHAAMMVHPGPLDVAKPPMIACSTFDVHYTGVQAHASAFPERGVNAADALTVAQTAIGLLRQHIRRGDRVHGIVTNGGEAPNIIPGESSARYIVRSPTIDNLADIKTKVERCFSAGALATGAELEIRGGDRPYAQMEHADDLVSLYCNNARALGREFQPLGRDLERSAASTDMGNISLRIPSIHPIIGVDAKGSVPHQPAFAAACIGPSAERAVCDGALALAGTVIDLALRGEHRTALIG